jgi:uncharacterized protein YecE (DUF72 family)
MGATYYIGTSGWHYAHWRGPFYPAELAPRHWLEYYARQFGTVEINASFYRLPTLAAVRQWCETVPSGFRFAIKASRTITHMKKLRDPGRSLRLLFARVRAFGDRAGPVLFQLPPRWRCNPARLSAFLRRLPRGREYAFELRDPSWHNPQVYALLRRHRAAFCIYQLAGFESPRVVTADFAYVRLHGPGAWAYSGSYSEAALAAWAQTLRGWGKVKRVYVYFDNDEAAFAARDALRLKQLLAR